MKFPKLLPSADRFNELLAELAGKSCEGAAHLKDYVEGDAVRKEQAASKIGICKSEAKKISSDITLELCTSYITPFDREDIQDLTGSLYKIPKMIEKIQERLEIYGAAIEKKDFTLQVTLIQQEAEALDLMVKALLKKQDTDTIKSQAELLYELENRGDQLLSQLLATLYSEDRPARELMASKDIYDMLEKVIDRYRDVAGVALRIVLKYS